MRSVRLLSLSLTPVLALGMSVSALAASISAGTSTTVANGGQAPGSATNYDFYDFGKTNQPIHLTTMR